MSGVDSAALAAALERDPALAHRLERLQYQAATGLDTLIQDVAQWLARQAPPPAALAGAVNVAALGAAARQRQNLARDQRELAEAFVLGALINQGNPAWNPLDPTSSGTPADSLLATLLVAALEQPAAPDAPSPN